MTPLKTALTAALTLALLPLPAAAQDLPPQLADIVETRRADCAGFEEGKLTIEHGAVKHVDLNGDGTQDTVLDEFYLRCSSAASLFCGTGGCMVNFLVDDALDTRLAKGWTVTLFPPLTVVLTQVHGSLCGGTNLTACVEALVWDAEAGSFSTVAPPVE